MRLRQRAQAGLLVAVAHRPGLLILDEPSSGLDAVVRRDILDAIVRTVADDGRTVIFSSHLLDEVERMSDHVTLMHHGRVTLSGTLDEVRSGYQRSRVRFIEHFEQPPVLETALAMEGDRERCLAAGMDDYITKPIKPEELLKALEQCTPTGVPARWFAPPIDRQVIEQLRELQEPGGADFVTELVEHFRLEVPKQVERMEHAASASDASADLGQR